MASIFKDPGQWVEDFFSPATGSGAIKEAAGIEAAATSSANQLQKYIYDQQREDLAPFRDVGLSALAGLQDPTLGVDLQQDPGYQFRMDEGLKAVGMAGSARGSSMGGAAQKALMRYGQGMASQEYGNAYNRSFNRLSQLAGIGSGSQAQLTQASGQYGQNVGQNIMRGADAQANAVMSAQQGRSNLLGQAAMGYGMFNRGGS